MATGIIELFPGGEAPDGSSGNAAAAFTVEKCSGSPPTDAPNVHQAKLLFDGATQDECWLFSLILPADFSLSTTPLLRGVCKFTSATSGTAIMKAGQQSTTNGSTDDDAAAFAAKDVSASISAPATQGQTVEFTINLTTTGMAANRKCVIFIGRDYDNASDTITTDLELLGLVLEYTVA